MIQLFRTIRRDLLNKKKLGNYFFYALGEILLVVLGILIALQINNWNEGQKLSALEQKLLVAIKTDLEATKNDLKTDIRSTDKLMAYTDSLYNSLYYRDNYKGSFPFRFPLSRTFQRGALFAKISAYESLKSAGINIISNDSLRNRITEFYELGLGRVRVNEEIMLHYRNNYLIPVMEETFTTGDDCSTCKSLREVIDNGTDKNWISIETGDSQLKFVLKSFFESLRSQKRRYEEVLDEIEALSQHLSAEIN
jgi:hypothetical protein